MQNSEKRRLWEYNKRERHKRLVTVGKAVNFHNETLRYA